jgi:cytochrome c-type biogenesis protein CcmE
LKKNKLILLAGIIITFGVVVVLMAATPGTTAIELKLHDLVANQEKFEDDYITVEGFLVEESIQWDADKIELKFDVIDDKESLMHVTYDGVKPDNFSEGVIVILQGNIKDAKNGKVAKFVAEKVQTRCPSKYEGADMENYDPKEHKQYIDNKIEEK